MGLIYILLLNSPEGLGIIKWSFMAFCCTGYKYVMTQETEFL